MHSEFFLRQCAEKRKWCNELDTCESARTDSAYLKIRKELEKEYGICLNKFHMNENEQAACMGGKDCFYAHTRR